MRTSLILLSVALTPTLHAQPVPFAPPGAQWTYETGIWSGPDTSLLIVQASGDTVIAGRACSMLTASGAVIICHAGPQFISNSNDSTFYWDPTSATHQLLFRWNAVPGDQWSTRIAMDTYADTVDWTVVDTGHVVIDGLYLRTVSTTQATRNNVLFLESGAISIERLGDPTGPFRWTTGFCDAETFNALRCYGDSSISWLNPQFPQCALSSGIQEAGMASAMTISPSPVEAGQPFTVALPPGMVDAQLRILDAAGRSVLDRGIHGTATISLARPGLYLVQLRCARAAGTPQRLIVR